MKRLRRKLFAVLVTMTMIALQMQGITLYADDSSVTFTFSDSGISASDTSASGYEIDGTELTITDAGTYTVTGSCSDGTIVVKKGVTGVTLILKDLTLTATSTAPLVAKKTTEVTLDIQGTVNLTDGENPEDEDSEDEEVADAFEGACIKVKDGGSLTITGDGTLNLDASACKNGIKGAANSTVTIAGATVNVEAANNGVASDNLVVISGGTLDITAADDAVHSSGDLTITDGTFTISAGDDGIHADYVTTIGTSGSSTGPYIKITESVESIEGATVNLYSGYANTIASDDGVNAANSDLSGYTYSLNISGGEWNINAEGDGLDSNANITMTGGEMRVFAASSSQAGNTALDYDGSCTFSGGTLLAAGFYANMGSIVPSSGTYTVFNGSTTSSSSSSSSSSQFGPGGNSGMGGQGGGSNTVITSAGDIVNIKDSSGNILYTYTAPKNATHIIFGSSDIKSGSTYYITIGDEGGTSANEEDETTSKKEKETTSSSEDETTSSSEEETTSYSDDEVPSASVSYQTHVQTYGWQDFVSDGSTSGTTGEAKRLEGIKIEVDSELSGSIYYRTHVQTYGWLDYVSDGALSGTTGEAKRLEAIQIYLTGELAEYYDVYYRVHAQTFGWLDWACNGEESGTAGYAKRLEGIQIVLVKKSETFSGDTTTPYYNKSDVATIKYTAYVQSYGWQSYVTNGKTSGTVGKAKRLEAIKIYVSDGKGVSGGVTYRTHVQSVGWQSWVSDGSLAGTTGKALRLEAVQIQLVHKNAGAPGSTKNAYVKA